MSRSYYLLKGLELGPPSIARLIRAIDKGSIDSAPQTGRFTPREIAAHLADLEPVTIARIEQALAEPGSLVASWDQDEEALRKDYPSWDVETSLTTFAEQRAKLLTILRQLSTEDTNLTVVHEVNGPMTIQDLATFALGHDMYHVEQLTEYLS